MPQSAAELTSTRCLDRRGATRAPALCLGASPSIAAAEDQAAGASLMSLRSTFAATSSCQTLLVGDATGCLGCLHTAWVELAPDWVCEVLSPSTG